MDVLPYNVRDQNSQYLEIAANIEVLFEIKEKASVKVEGKT